jgi:hypothetical protein
MDWLGSDGVGLTYWISLLSQMGVPDRIDWGGLDTLVKSRWRTRAHDEHPTYVFRLQSNFSYY